MTETHRNPAHGSRIARLPVDAGSGLPIPFTAGILPNGRPDFSVVDVHKMVQVLERGVCGVCGQRLGSWLAFIGGFHSARVGIFFDPPMHRSCAEAALTLCPHVEVAQFVISEHRSVANWKGIVPFQPCYAFGFAEPVSCVSAFLRQSR